MKRAVFTFTNSKGVKYRVYYKNPKFYITRKGKKIAVDALGTCDAPDSKKPKIIIKPKLSERREIEVITEEFCHAFFYELLEKDVRPFATILAKFLRKKGWKKIQ